MTIRTNRTLTATAIGVTLGAIALASPAAFAAPSNSPADINTVVSVEGPSGNLLMPMWQSVPKTTGTTKVVTDSTGQKVRMSAKSVAVQSLTAFKEARVTVTWTWYPSFNAPYFSKIAGVPGKGADGWYFRVNGIAFAKGANVVNLSSLDRVVWAWGQEKQSALDIVTPGGSAPGSVVGPGPFTATIQQVATRGARTAAVGATVTYGTQTGTTDDQGNVQFEAATGIATMRATKPGMVAATRSVCTLGTDPACPAE